MSRFNKSSHVSHAIHQRQNKRVSLNNVIKFVNFFILKTISTLSGIFQILYSLFILNT